MERRADDVRTPPAAFQQPSTSPSTSACRRTRPKVMWRESGNEVSLSRTWGSDGANTAGLNQALRICHARIYPIAVTGSVPPSPLLSVAALQPAAARSGRLCGQIGATNVRKNMHDLGLLIGPLSGDAFLRTVVIVVVVLVAVVVVPSLQRFAPRAQFSSQTLQLPINAL